MPVRAGCERLAAPDQQGRAGWKTFIGHRLEFSGSVHFGAGELDDLAPLLGFVGYGFAELGSRSANRRDAQIGKSRLRRGIGERSR